LKSEPPDTYIFLNGKQVENQSGFLQSGTLIDNLEKGEYRILLQADGRFDWEKNVAIKPSLVEVFDSVILVPKKDPEPAGGPTTKFYIINQILALEKDGEIFANDAKLIGTKIEDLAQNGSIVTYNDRNKNYYLANIFEFNSSLNINTLFNNLKESRLGLPGAVPVIKVLFHPFNYKKIIVQSRGALYNLDTSRLDIEQIAENVKDFRVNGEEVVFYDEEAIYRYNLIFRNKSKLADLKQDEGKSRIGFEIDSAGRVITLFNNGELVILINNDDRLVIANKVRLFSDSSDGRFIAFVDYDGPLYAYRIDKGKYIKLITDINEEILEIKWYKDNKHLFVRTANGLYFTEVDDNLPLNTVKLASDVTQFDYESDAGTLYFGTPAGIFKLEI